MAASFVWAQSTGTSGSQTRTDLASSGNIMNFQNADSSTPADYATNVITASDAANGGNSYELWFQGHWTGTFNTISNLKFWQSVAFSPATGITVKYACTATYATPTANDSAITTGQTNTTTIPTTVPGTHNIGIANSLTGTLSVAGYSDYIVLQIHGGTTVTPGDTSLGTYTLQYDET